jgi:hypothetical protein
VDRRYQFGQQLNRERVAALGPVESQDSYLRGSLLDKNDWHRVNVENRMTNVELNLDDAGMEASVRRWSRDIF